MRVGAPIRLNLFLFGILLLFSKFAYSQETNEPGIWLEMGLLACERGEREDAERLFRYVETHFAPPTGIQAIIYKARLSGCLPRHKPPGHMAVGAGWSSNVNLGPAQSHFYLAPLELGLANRYRARSDGYVFLEGEHPLFYEEGSLLAFGSFRHNLSVPDFDEGLFGIFYQHDERLTDGKGWLASGMVTESILGGQHYADTAVLHATYAWDNFSLAGLWHVIQYPGAHALDASVNHVRAETRWELGKTRWIAQIGALFDKPRNENRPGGERRGWLMNLQAGLQGPWQSRLEISWRREEITSQKAYLTGLFDMRRKSHVQQVEISWLFPHRSETAWRIDLTYVHADDNIPFLSYRRYTIGLAHVFAF